MILMDSAATNSTDTLNTISALLQRRRYAPAQAMAEAAWPILETPSLQAELANLMAGSLWQGGFWEQAAPWLDAMMALGVNIEWASSKKRRAQWPVHLEPEVFDPIAGKTLMRYAPRESADFNYVIDIVGTCNLRCPSCPVANSPTNLGAVRKGTMPIELFETILEKIARESPSQRPTISLFNWGEPLLHPQLSQIIRLVRDRDWSCVVSTNLNHVPGVEQLISAPPNTLKISLSGFTPESYESCHEGGDLDRLKTNMHRLAQGLTDNDSCDVIVGHHLYKHTQDSQPAVAALCEELGFSYAPIQAFWQPLERVLERVEGNTDAHPLFDQLKVDPADNAAFVRKHRTPNTDCELRFNQTNINVDGSVALCCGVYEDANMLGVQFLDTPHEQLQQRKYQHEFCSRCRKAGLDYSVIDLPESSEAP